jgi:hypothetical protein
VHRLCTIGTSQGLWRTEPGQGAARSLSLVTAVFCTLHPSLDNNVALRVITHLVDEVGPAFGEAHKQLVDDEMAYQAAET